MLWAAACGTRAALADERTHLLAVGQSGVFPACVSGLASRGQLVQCREASLFRQDVVLVAAKRLPDDLAAAGVPAVGDLLGDKALLVVCKAEVSARVGHCGTSWPAIVAYYQGLISRFTGHAG